MGGKGGGGSTATTVQQSDPWGPQQPYLTGLYERAQGLPTQQAYPFPAYVPYSPTTAQAIGMQTERALAGSPLQQQAQATNLQTLQGGYMGGPASQALGNVAAGQYLGTSPGYGPLAGIASGVPQAANPAYDYLVRGAGGGHILANPAGPALTPMSGGQLVGTDPGSRLLARQATGGYNPALDYLAPTARGDFLLGGPQMDQAFEAARARISPAVAGTFSRAGRYGSGLQQATETEALGRAFSDLYGQERARQLGAAQQIGALTEQGLGRQLAASQALGSLGLSQRGQQLQAGLGLGGLYQTGVGQALGAAGQLGGLYQGGLGQQLQAGANLGGLYSQDISNLMQGAEALGGLTSAERDRMTRAVAMAPALAQADYADIGQLAAAGTAQELKAGEALKDAIDRWRFEQQEPYSRLAFQSQVIQGGYPGGITTSEQPIYSNPIGAGLGGALAGSQLAPMLGMTGPIGAAAGGGLALLGALK